MKSLVTVVVPVYKVEKYIEKCIQSLLQQTYVNIEIIIIDDGSPDNSGVICDNIALKDSRIHVIHKENEGVSVARNTGIEQARGKYICFVDSDDYVKTDYIEKMVQALEKDDVELVVCGHIRKKMDKETEVFSLPQGIIDRGNAYFYKYLSVNIEACYPWNKLFCTDIIKENNITFPKGIHPGEDLFFCIHYLNYIKTASFIKEYLYVYVDSATSVMSRNKGKSVFNNYYLQLVAMDKLLKLKQTDQAYRKCCRVRVFEICCCLLYDNKKFKLHKEMSYVKQLFRENAEVLKQAEYVPVRIKFRFHLMAKCPLGFDLLQTLYRQFYEKNRV